MTTRNDLEALAAQLMEDTDGDLPTELVEAAHAHGLSQAGIATLAQMIDLCPIHLTDPEVCAEEGCEA